MKTKTFLLIIVLLPGLVGFSPAPSSLSAGSSRPLAALATSAFGYTVTSPLAYNWRDITGFPGADISASFDGADDGKALVPLGLVFPFFENLYNEVHVSTNGLLLFTLPTSRYPENGLIPVLEEPNNFIAAFWDDLYLGEEFNESNPRRIYFHVYQDETPKKAVVTWRVTRRDEPDLLEFQAILSENGNIVFNYKQLDGKLDEATVGIEDVDGVDGMQSIYNEAGLSNNLAIGYTFPTGSPRYSGKASTHTLGGFLSNRTVEFPFWIQNTSTVDARFSLGSELQETNSGYDWRVDFVDADRNKLTNVTGDSKVDTPVIPAGIRATYYIRVTGPAINRAGNYARFLVTMIPTLSPLRKFEINLSATVPAPFAQAYVDTGLGMFVQLSRENDVSTVFAVDYFTGSTLTMSETAKFGMIFAWEHQQQYMDQTANIEYVQVNSLANTLSGIQTIQFNEERVKDEYPKVTVAPNGRMGFAFNRKAYDVDKYNWIDNVYFVVLEPDGTKVNGHNPFSVSGNTERTGRDTNGPMFNSAPSLAVTSDNRFMLSWQVSQRSGTVQSDDLYIQLFDSEGNTDPASPAPVKLTDSEAGVTRYTNPDLTELPGDYFLLTYTIYEDATSTNTIAYRVLDGQGQVTRAETIIPGMQGQRVEAAFLGNDSQHVLLTWSNPVSSLIGYAVLDENMDLLDAPVELDSPTRMAMDFPSVTRDLYENGIITWGDTSDMYLYYALVDSNGSLVTPPMIFRKGGSEGYPRLKTSQAGEGNTTLSSASIYRRYVPVASGRSR